MMNLPTVTFEPGSQFDEEADYAMWDGRGVAFDGKTRYALVRVADGQTTIAEKVWWCDKHQCAADRSTSAYCHSLDTWYGGSEYDGSACVLDEVTLVRGADI